MLITAVEARNNVRKFKKDFGTSSLEKILKEIQKLSENGESQIKLGYCSYPISLNKKDYYLLKQNGFNIEFSATYESIKVNNYCSNVKRRAITLTEYFNYSNNLTDKEVKISW